MNLKVMIRTIVTNSNMLSMIRRKCYYVQAVYRQYRCKKKYLKTNFPQIIREYKGKYAGKRCFVIGNGPSLNAKDLEKLKDEYSFAANRIWLIYNKTEWRPTFYMCQDRQMIRGEYKRIKQYPAPVFLGYNAMEEFGLEFNNAIAYFLDTKPQLRRQPEMPFSSECDKCIVDGTTVTYSSIQLAIYMGFTEIYLLGVDNSYQYNMDKNRKITFDPTVSSSYFDPHYKDVYNEFGQGKNKVFGVSDPEMSIMIYSAARRFAEKINVKIFNATRGGKLEVFERINFDDLF